MAEKKELVILEERERAGLLFAIRQTLGMKPEESVRKRLASLQERLSASDVLDEEGKRTAKYLINVMALCAQGKKDVLKSAMGLEDPGADASGFYAVLPPEDASALAKRMKKEKGPAPRKLYISDLHFFHEALNTQMDRRGFAGAEQMNEAMIRIWNQSVREKDEVYILGDLSLGSWEKTRPIVEQLKGKLHLILGNHDQYVRDAEFDPSLFVWIRDYARIRDDGRTVILFHYPVFCYPGQYRRHPSGEAYTYMLYGHVHNTRDEILVNHFIQETRNFRMKCVYQGQTSIPCQMINTFCMFSGYRPLTLDEWIRTDEERRAGMPAFDGSEPDQILFPGK